MVTGDGVAAYAVVVLRMNQLCLRWSRHRCQAISAYTIWVWVWVCVWVEVTGAGVAAYAVVVAVLNVRISIWYQEFRLGAWSSESVLTRWRGTVLPHRQLWF